MLRRVITQARDLAAVPVKERLRRDRENAPRSLAGVLAYFEEHSFDEDLSVQAALDAAGVSHNVATLVAEYLGMPGKVYFRTAQVKTAQLLPPVLQRDYGLEAPTGEIAAAVGLPAFSTFCNWHNKVLGTPPEIFVWPKALKPGLDYYTWDRFSRRKQRLEDARAILNELACIERLGNPPLEIQLLGDRDPILRARAETVERIQRDQNLLPDHLQPLLDYIAENLFNGLTATQAVLLSSICDKQNASDQLKFHLGETTKSYITKRWVEAAAYAFGESDLDILEIATSLGQNAKRTVYRWVSGHTGENPGKLRRSRPAPEGLVDYPTWRLAGYGVPWAVQAVTDCLHAMEDFEKFNIELAMDPKPGVPGLEERLEFEVGTHPMVAGSAVFDLMWQDPRNIDDCVRAALDTSYRSQLLGDKQSLNVDSSDLAQLAYSAAQARLRKMTGDVELEEERVALTELVFGLVLLRDLPSGNAEEKSIAHLRAGLARLAKETSKETRRFMDELKVARNLVRECLERAVDLEFSHRTQVIDLSCETFEIGLLNQERSFDEYRWALASKAEIARIATEYTAAESLIAELDLNRPFDDMTIAGTVHWIAGVIQGEAGKWKEAFQSLDRALSLMEATERPSDAIKVRISRGLILMYCGNEEAYSQFQACLRGAAGDPMISFWAMTNLITSKAYFDLPDELSFGFDEFVTVAEHSAGTKAWVPFCRALMETKPRIARSLFLCAEAELKATMQILPATIASLFAALESSKEGKIQHAYQLGVKVAVDLKASQAFGGRLALAAETFLANLSVSVGFDERIRGFLQKVQMPYLSSGQE
jgi:hypothetical protein